MITSALNGAFVATTSFASALLGSSVFATAAASFELTDIERNLVGPVGFIAFGSAVMVWLVARLKAADEREARRTIQHDETIKTLVELGISSNTIIERSSDMMEQVVRVIEGCPGRKQ